MSEEISKLVNSPLLWAITIITIALVVLLAVLYLVKTVRFGKQVGLTAEQMKIAVKTSCTSSLGPCMVIMVGMIALLVAVGAPTALMRLSVVGNVSYELISAGFAAEAFGTQLEPASMTPQIFQTAVFIMAVGCIGYLVVPMIFATSFEKTLDRMNGSGRNKNLSALISSATLLACYAYIEVPYVVSLDASTVALFAGFFSTLVLSRVQQKTGAKWLLEWGMLICMFIGMIAGVIAK